MYVAEWSLTVGLLSITPESSFCVLFIYFFFLLNQVHYSGTIIVADVVVTLAGTSIVLTRLLIVNISLTW